MKITNCKQCNILIAPIVIDELESKKISNKKSTRKINKILKKIEEYSLNKTTEISINVFVQIIAKKPSQNTYDVHGLNFKEQDHRLFASILEFQKKEIDDVILISDDTGNRIRAKHYGINAIKLPLELRLPDEPDPNELKIRELEKENLKLKMKVPKPLIVFGNEKKYFGIASKVGMRKFLFSSLKETLHSTLVILNGIETVAL